MDKIKKEHFKNYCKAIIVEFLCNDNFHFHTYKSKDPCTEKDNRFAQYSRSHGLDKAIDIMCGEFIDAKFIEKTTQEIKILLKKYEECEPTDKSSVCSELNKILPEFIHNTYKFFGFNNFEALNDNSKNYFDNKLLQICYFPFLSIDEEPYIEIYPFMDALINDDKTNYQSDDNQSDDNQSGDDKSNDDQFDYDQSDDNQFDDDKSDDDKFDDQSDDDKSDDDQSDDNQSDDDKIDDQSDDNQSDNDKIDDQSDDQSDDDKSNDDQLDDDEHHEMIQMMSHIMKHIMNQTDEE